MFTKDQLKVIIKKVGIWYVISLAFMYIVVFIFGSLEAFSFNILFVAGLLGGPFGAVAVSLAFVSFFALNGLLNHLTFNSFLYLILIIVSCFVFSYLVYKLWYSIDSSGLSIRLNSAESIVKFLLILFFSAIFSMVLSVVLFYNLNVDYPQLFPLFLACFTLSLILIPILLVANYFQFTFYYPGKEDIDFLNRFYEKYDNNKFIKFVGNHPEIFNISFVLFLICMLLSLIASINIRFIFFFDLFMYLTLIFGLIFIFKPLTNLENQENNYLNFLSITEIVTCLIVAIFVLLFMALSIADYFNLELNFNLYGPLTRLFIKFDIIVLIITIPSLFLLLYIQKRITNPLTKLSSIVNEYFSTNKISAEDEDYFKNFFHFLNRETEVSILARSFYKMDNDLNSYVENIKSLTKAKERMDAELNVAQKIQNSFLPTNFNINPNVQIDGEMVSAELVGGDFYDFFMIDDNHLAFVIGDVSDKGIPAALFMSKSIQLIQSYLNTLNSVLNLNDVIGLINNKLCENNEDSNMFVTAFIGILDLNSGKVSYVNAGHEQPILKLNNDYSYLDSENDLVLGVMENEEFTVHELVLNKGDGILLYTDGVVDAINSENEFFGRDRLLDIIKSNNSSIYDVIKDVKDSILDFTHNHEQFDDITLLAIEFNPKENAENNVLHEEKELILSSTKENALYDVFESVNDLIDNYTQSTDIKFRIELIIEEIFVNIVKHAYEEEEGIIKIQYAILDDPLRFKIVFIDDGNEFNPLMAENPNLSDDIDEREVGHLGIFMVKEYSDEMTYDYIDNQNVLSVYVKL